MKIVCNYGLSLVRQLRDWNSKGKITNYQHFVLLSLITLGRKVEFQYIIENKTKLVNLP